MGNVDLLHLDDNRYRRAVVKKTVGSGPIFRVHSCGSTAEALAATANWSPDLILLRLGMPGHDGSTALTHLRQRAHTSAVPIIYLANEESAQNYTDLSDPGVVGIIPRALDAAQLCGKIYAIMCQRLRQYEKPSDTLGRRAAMALAIIESSADGIVAKDLEGRILLWNAAAERMSKFRADDVIGRNYRTIIPTDQLPHEEEIFDKIRTGQAIDEFETRRIQKDGSIVDISLKVSPIRDQAGNVVGSASVATDISARKAMETALQASEGRLELAVQGMSVGLWDWDIARDSEYWSDRYKNMMGLPSEFIPSNAGFMSRLHPEDHDRVDAAMAAHLEQRAPYDIEYRLRKADGDYLWVRARGQAAWDADGKPLRMVGSVDDISARRQAEDKLHRLNEQLEEQVASRTAELRIILNALPSMIAYWDKDLRCNFANPAYLRWFGFDRPEEVVGCHLQSILGPSLFSQNEPFIRAALADEPQNFQRTQTKRDGSIAHTWTNYVPHHHDGGEVLGFFVVFTDVTPIWEAERRTRESEARYRMLAENSSDIIFQLDRDLVRRYVSPACQDMLGYEESELIGSAALGKVHPDDVGKMRQGTKLLLNGDLAQCIFTCRIKHRDGHWVWVEAAMRGYRDPDSGDITGIVGALRDNSARKAIEELVSQRTEQLEHANRELDAFAYAASHDLKAPLRIIGKASKWLEKDLQPHLNDETRKTMWLLRSRVERMDKLLDDLLRFSKIGHEGGGTDIISGQELIENVLALLTPPDSFTVTIGAGFAAIHVARMPAQQVLMNLIGNAIKHHHRQTGRIDVAVEDRGDHLAFSVSDDGPGIPAAFHDKVFQMFQTLKPRDQVEGSGMGLAIVRKQVEMSGGTLALQSSEGQGSTFRFTLPKIPSHEAATGPSPGRAG